ncbi:MAG: hypothetical protein P8K08_20360 [Fuerstiella sp.]|nr:hypothetical protein [Fuerstiella sp.]
MTFNFRPTGVRLLAAMSLTFLPIIVSAQHDKGDEQLKANSARVQAGRLNVTKLSVNQQDDALEFARKHHPELANLLERLQSTVPAGFFARGIREVHLARQRLERIREKQPARFESELKHWKIDSEIRLLTARWAMSRDPALEKTIRELLRTRQQSRMDRLNEERAKLAARLTQLDAQIGLGTEELAVDLVEEWNRLAKQATATARGQRRSPKKKTTVKTEPAAAPKKSRDTSPQTE